MKIFLRIFTLFFASLFFTFGLVACDQIKAFLPKKNGSEEFSATSKSPEQALESVKAAVAAGQFEKSLSEAKTYAELNGPLQADFAYEAAKSSAKIGNTEDALRFLEQAIEPLGLETTQLMFEPAFETLQQNPAFLILITKQGNKTASENNSVSDQGQKNSHSKTVVTTTTITTTSTNAVASQAKPQRKSNNGDVSISKDVNEVRAGDVHIKLP